MTNSVASCMRPATSIAARPMQAQCSLGRFSDDLHINLDATAGERVRPGAKR